MKNFLLYLLTPLTKIIQYFILKHIDTDSLVDVEKTITKGFDIKWVNLDNIVKIENQYGLSYVLKEVKLNFFNEQDQPIGNLHFNSPVKIAKNSAERITMPSKMSNVTAIFNAARLLLVDELEMRATGYSLIRILWFDLKIPMDDVLKVEKGKLQYGSDEEVAERASRAQLRREKRKQRQERWKEKRRERRESIQANRQKKKEERYAKKQDKESLKYNKLEQKKESNDHSDQTTLDKSSEELS